MIKPTFVPFTHIPSPVSHAHPQLYNRMYVRFEVPERIVCYKLQNTQMHARYIHILPSKDLKRKKSLAPAASAGSIVTILPQEGNITTHPMMVKPRSEDIPLVAKQGLTCKKRRLTW